jgi:hypothetical protein
MAGLVLEVEDDGRRFQKILTFREIAYLSGVLSSDAAMQVTDLCPILPQEEQYMSRRSYFKKIQRGSPLSLQKKKPGFKGLSISISTRSLRKLLKVVFTPLSTSTLIRFPKPFPMEIAILVVMMMRGRP